MAKNSIPAGRYNVLVTGVLKATFEVTSFIKCELGKISNPNRITGGGNKAETHWAHCTLTSADGEKITVDMLSIARQAVTDKELAKAVFSEFECAFVGTEPNVQLAVTKLTAKSAFSLGKANGKYIL